MELLEICTTYEQILVAHCFRVYADFVRGNVHLLDGASMVGPKTWPVGSEFGIYVSLPMRGNLS